MTTNTKERTNTQICVSFGRDVKELLSLLDEARKKEHMNRSSWIKARIREQCGVTNSANEVLVYS